MNGRLLTSKATLLKTLNYLCKVKLIMRIEFVVTT